MEPTQTRKIYILVTVTLLVIFLAGPGVMHVYRKMTKIPLGGFVKPELPILVLRLEFVDTQGKKIPGETTRLGKGPSPAAPNAQVPVDCPELVGGDTADRTQAEDGKKRDQTCPGTARWVVKRHPIGFSLYFEDAKKVLALFDEKTMVSELFHTRFFQGLFYEPLQNAGIPAEDLHLEGIEGAFLRTLIREALSAHGELHYDVAHGKRGFVFSFVRDKCAYMSKALPVIARSLARSAYRIPTLKELVLEMRIGHQRLFLTEVEDRIYMANGLEALINVFESLPEGPRPSVKSPLVLTVRSGAFVSNLPQAVIGDPEWEIRLGLGLAKDNPGTLEFGAGKLTRALCPKIYKGVPAGIPHDVVAAIVTSYPFSPEMKAEDWRRIASEGPGPHKSDDPPEGGVAVIWDLDAQVDGITQMGVVIAGRKTPGTAEKYKAYFRDPELTAECGGGTVFLAATSEKLLARMKESCGGRSLSILDWERGGRAKEFDTAQFFLFLNPGGGIRELFLGGGAAAGGEAGEFEPQWKKEYEAAKAAMRKDGEKIFGALPIFAYSGAASPTAKTVELKGFTVKQGGAK